LAESCQRQLTPLHPWNHQPVPNLLGVSKVLKLLRGTINK
jgi:hypothetical protein